MTKYRKLPVIIDAVEWNATREAWDNIIDMGLKNWKPDKLMDTDCFFIETLEGDHKAQPGDFIIKGVAGEFYPCKPDIFHATYEKAE